MTDRERLRDKLGKLAAGRIAAHVDARSDAALMRSIATLVDETVLPREVTLSVEDVKIVLTISRRRLVQVAGDVHASFDEDGEAPLLTLRGELSGMLKGREGISVHAERAEIPPEMQGAGPSAEALAAAWGVALYAEPGGVGALAAMLQGKAYAWVAWHDGELREEGGDPAYLKTLKTTVARQELRAQHGGARGLVAVGGNSFATAIGFAWDGGAETAFVVARIDLAPLAAAFNGA